MATLLEKVQTLISANLHYLVDQSLKQNSIAVINQYIREVENNLDDLSEATATVGGNVKTIRRKYEEFQGQGLWSWTATSTCSCARAATIWPVPRRASTTRLSDWWRPTRSRWNRCSASTRA